jgi:hypothetical protein
VRFSKSVEDPDRAHPLGDVPFLVTRIRTRRNAKGQTILSLLPKKGNGLDLALSENLMHGLIRLIKDSAVKAEWNLNLEVPTFSHSPSEIVPEERTLN